MKKIIILILFLTISLSINYGCKSKNLNEENTGDLDKLLPILYVDQPQQTYIEDIKLCGAYWDRYSTNAAGRINDYFSTEANGRNYQKTKDINLNRDCGTTTDCIYLYDTKTTNRDKAITNIIAITSSSKLSDTIYIDYSGVVYYSVGGIRVNSIDTSTSTYALFDLNMGAGGKYIYLYVTRDTRYNPITGLDICDGVTNLKDDHLFVVNANSNAVQDLNEGAGGADIFMGFTRKVTGYETYKFTVKDYTAEGKYTTKTYLISGPDPKIKAEHIQPIVDKGEYSHFICYVYSTNYNSVKVGDYAGFYNFTAEALWSYNIEFDLSAFGLENIVYENAINASPFPNVSLPGYVVTGWHYKGTNIEVNAKDKLYRGGMLEPTLKTIYESDFEEFKTEYKRALMLKDSPAYFKVYYDNLAKNHSMDENIMLAYTAVLYSMNLQYVNNQVIDLDVPKELINTTIEYSSLSDDDKTLIEIQKNYLLVCSDEDINNALTYYNNDGQTESILDEVMIDLCNNEIERRK